LNTAYNLLKLNEEHGMLSKSLIESIITIANKIVSNNIYVDINIDPKTLAIYLKEYLYSGIDHQFFESIAIKFCEDLCSKDQEIILSDDILFIIDTILKINKTKEKINVMVKIIEKFKLNDIHNIGNNIKLYLTILKINKFDSFIINKSIIQDITLMTLDELTKEKNNEKKLDNLLILCHNFNCEIENVKEKIEIFVNLHSKASLSPKDFFKKSNIIMKDSRSKNGFQKYLLRIIDKAYFPSNIDIIDKELYLNLIKNKYHLYPMSDNYYYNYNLFIKCYFKFIENFSQRDHSGIINFFAKFNLVNMANTEVIETSLSHITDLNKLPDDDKISIFKDLIKMGLHKKSVISIQIIQKILNIIDLKLYLKISNISQKIELLFYLWKLEDNFEIRHMVIF
jgi:hypothetical protein